MVLTWVISSFGVSLVTFRIFKASSNSIFEEDVLTFGFDTFFEMPIEQVRLGGASGMIIVVLLKACLVVSATTRPAILTPIIPNCKKSFND